MSWIFYAFGSAIFAGISAVVEKKLLFKGHAMEFSATVGLFNFLGSLPFLFLIDFSYIKVVPLLFLFFSSILGAVAFVFIAKSIRHMEISVASPILVLGPGITALFAFVFINERLSFHQIGGIIFLVAGVYVLETHKYDSFFEPIKMLLKSAYIHLILLALVFYGITGLIDRVVLSKYNFNPFAFIVIVNIFLFFNLMILMVIFHDGIKGLNHGIRSLGWGAVAISAFTIAYRLFAAHAIKIAAVGIVESVKRTSVLFSVVVGGEMFHEKNLMRKTIASLIMIVGAILIVI